MVHLNHDRSHGLVPEAHRRLGAGLVGFGGAIGGVIFNLVVGYLLTNGYGYANVSGLVSMFHVAAFCLILVTVRRVRPLIVPQKQMSLKQA